MGTKELSHAYPRMIREWVKNGGFTLRLLNPNNKGVPDFVLAHKVSGPIFCEVKSVAKIKDKIGLEFHQAQNIANLTRHGCRAIVLVLCHESDVWHVFKGAENMTIKYSTLTAEWANFILPELDPSSLLYNI